MPATVIVGLQWGDEGKGKTTDFLAEQTALVVRYQGGDNAGHTVVLGDEVFKLHLVPSGVLYPHIVPVIGPGVVVNPATLIDEIDGLTSRGIDVGRLRVSFAAHVIMPYHVALDVAREMRLAEGQGRARPGAASGRPTRTARRGSGCGWRTCSTPTRCGRSSPGSCRRRTPSWLRSGRRERFEVEPLVEQALAWGRRLAPHLADATWLVQDALRRGEHVLLEGAQGTLLDLDHGSYPFVTSSSPIAGGACTGGGIGPRQIDEVFGVMKAYATRVGLRARSRPSCSTTSGRGSRSAATRSARRPAGRAGSAGSMPCRRATRSRSTRSARSCSTSSTSCPGVDPIRLCVAYEIDGTRVEAWPSSAALLDRAMPIYEDFAGWEEPIHAVRALSDLPEAARRYVTALEEHAGAPIVLVVGRARSGRRRSSGRGARCATACWPAHEPARPADPDPDRRWRRPRARPGLEAGR